MSVGPVSPTALSFRAPSSLPVIPCGVFLANGHGLRPPSGRISAVDARSFLRRNGHGLRPPSGRISAVDARSFLRRNGHGLRPPFGRISAVDARGLSPQPAFPACVPKRGTGFFCFDHPRTEERSQRARPLRPCPDTAGCRALRHALRAWIRRLPVVRPATAIASSTGPGYHALPTPGPPTATHDDSPAARRRDRHTQPDKRIGEGGADRMVAARPWPSGTAMLREKERNASKNSFSPLPPARKRHEFF